MTQLTHRTPSTTPLRVYVILAAGMIAISFASILIRIAQGEGMPSILIAASRLVLATLALTPFVLRRHRGALAKLTRGDLGLALVAGAFLALHFAAWVTSLEYTSVLISVVFVTSSPLWVALLEFAFLKERLSRQVIAGLLIAIGGGLLIGLAGTFSGATVDLQQQREWLGGGLSLIGAVAVAVYLIIGRKLQQPTENRTEPLPILAYLWLVYGSAGLLLTVWVVLAGIPVTGYSAEGYLALVAMAAFPQLIGHSSLNYAVRYLPATLVSMVTQLEPLGSAALAFVLFNEVPLPLQIAGSAIIISGVMLANFGRIQRKKSTQGTA